MKMNLEKLIKECYQAIEKDPLHFLGIRYRNMVFSMLSETQAGYLILNTIVHNIPAWKSEWPHDDKIESIVINCDEFLRKQITPGSLNSLLNSGLTYMENRLNEEKYNAVYAGLSSVYAGYEILNNSYIKDTTDELREDPSEWSSLLYASLSYNDGAGNINDINKTKNKVFWNEFFLGNIECGAQDQLLSFNQTKTKTRKGNDGITTTRKQPDLAKKNNKIKELQAALVKCYKDKYSTEKAQEIRIIFHSILNTATVEGRIAYKHNETEKIDNTELYLLGTELDALKVCQNIKELMYNLQQKEGAWLSMEMILDGGDSVRWQYNFDHEDDYITRYVDKASLALELIRFPRAIAYTPEWLSIIEKDNKPKS